MGGPGCGGLGAALNAGCMINQYIPVTFEDPQTRERRTITMYPGSRSGEPYWLDKDKKIKQYRNCQLNLVDCGWE